MLGNLSTLFGVKLKFSRLLEAVSQVVAKNLVLCSKQEPRSTAVTMYWKRSSGSKSSTWCSRSYTRWYGSGVSSKKERKKDYLNNHVTHSGLRLNSILCLFLQTFNAFLAILSAPFSSILHVGKSYYFCKSDILPKGNLSETF